MSASDPQLVQVSGERSHPINQGFERRYGLNAREGRTPIGDEGRDAAHAQHLRLMLICQHLSLEITMVERTSQSLTIQPQSARKADEHLRFAYVLAALK